MDSNRKFLQQKQQFVPFLLGLLTNLSSTKYSFFEKFECKAIFTFAFENVLTNLQS